MIIRIHGVGSALLPVNQPNSRGLGFGSSAALLVAPISIYQQGEEGSISVCSNTVIATFYRWIRKTPVRQG